MVFSIYHPIQYFMKIEDFDFSESKKYWFELNSYGVEVFNYYHPLEKYVKAIRQNGFQVANIVETTVPIDVDGWAQEKYRIPNSMIFVIIKS